MKSRIMDERGISRLIVILLIAVVILTIPIIWGVWERVRSETERKECSIAVQSAQRKLDDEYLLNPDMTKEEAERAATSEIRSLEETCPSGGKYIVKHKKDGSGYEIYCELHGQTFEK